MNLKFNTFMLGSFSSIALFLLLILLILAVILLIRLNKNFIKLIFKLNLTEKGIRDEIKISVQPKFIEASIEAKDMMDMAVEVWRIEQKLNKISEKLPDNYAKTLEVSVQKIKRFIERYDLEIKDFTGQKYNSGLSVVEVISVDKDRKVEEDIIKETVEPAILLKGQVIKKAKVIIASRG